VGGINSSCGTEGHVYKLFIEVYERKRPLGNPKRRWEDDIKWILKK
jgi:hypothetical protein